ncbi:hypothetical protein ig2599ANME_0436 [groundwater metagenome]
MELAKLKKDNMEWLEIEFQRPDELPELLEYYKKKILRALDLNDLTAAKKAISDFKKATLDRDSLIDLIEKHKGWIFKRNSEIAAALEKAQKKKNYLSIGF